MAMDLSVKNAAEELFKKTNALGLEVDILVNNAGVGAIGDFGSYDLAKV